MKTKIQALHEQALAVTKRYLQTEGELIDLLQKINHGEGYKQLGHTTLIAYATQALGLSPQVAYNMIGVAKKSEEVPALKEMVQSNLITLSNARVITPVLKPENQEVWLTAASTLSKRELEIEVAKANPKLAVKETAKPVCEDRIELKLGVSEKLFKNLKRVQDLVSSQTRTAATLEDTLEALVKLYLEKKDPLEKAKRSQARGEKKAAVKNHDSTSHASTNHEAATQPPFAPGQKKSPSKDQNDARARIEAKLLHQVNLRDGQQCTHKDPYGKRYGERRWIDIHHVQPVYLGGKNTLDNLTTLCKAHHRMLHDEIDH